jgi:hypothetical protein
MGTHGDVFLTSGAFSVAGATGFALCSRSEFGLVFRECTARALLSSEIHLCRFLTLVSVVGVVVWERRCPVLG